MSSKPTEDTPQLTRSVQGQSFLFYTPHVEGDTITGAEAAALNQTRIENIKNNVAEAVAEANKKAREMQGLAEDVTVVLSVEDHAALQDAITGYDMDYTFGMARVGGRIGDPVQAEARDMAWELCREALKKKGVKLVDITAEQKNKFISDAMAKYPQILEKAKTVVLARQSASQALSLDL